MHTQEQNNHVKILMVDDEENVLLSHHRTLRPHFQVYTAQGGRAALKTLETEGPFAVVISDIKMPSMSGIDLLSIIREKYPDTIRMVLTGYADLDLAINAINRGDIFRFMTKPCDNKDLIATIHAGITQFNMIEATREYAIVKRLQKGLEGTLRAFTKLVEFRDPYTAGHMDRVAKIATGIAEHLKLERDQIEALRLASLVHDIGKIAVPAGILNKPGLLNDAEFTLIKAHPLVGAEIFKTLDTEWPISRIILEHHERIDGSGYPNGLTGSQLLLESKIIAVSDVIDAITTHRPYRQSLGSRKAIEYLQENSGKLFDPTVTSTAIKMIENGLIPDS
nr:HD domain-containing phosphohydrolase [uncultured Pseudodesulfovibrio sp.]